METNPFFSSLTQMVSHKDSLIQHPLFASFPGQTPTNLRRKHKDKEKKQSSSCTSSTALYQTFQQWSHTLRPLPLAELESIQFEWIHPKHVEQHSVCALTNQTLSFKKRHPSFDFRLGSNGDFFCATCKEGSQTCPSHKGHLELVAPLLHPCTLKQVIQVARSVCFFCSALLISPEDPRWPLFERAPVEQKLKVASDIGMTFSYCGYCPLTQEKEKEPTPSRGGCGMKQPHFPFTTNIFKFHCFVEGPGHIIKEEDPQPVECKPRNKGKGSMPPKQTRDMCSPMPHFSLSVLYRVFQKVSEHDATLLGLSCRPEQLFLTTLCLSSISKNPENTWIGKQFSEIIRLNSALRLKWFHIHPPKHKEQEQKQSRITREEVEVWFSTPQGTILPTPPSGVSESSLKQQQEGIAFDPQHPSVRQDFARLQWEVASLFKPSLSTESLPLLPLKSTYRVSLPEFLKGKEKFIRKSLQGQSTNFSSRAVVTQGPDLDLDEVLIPLKTACIETKRIRVNAKNKQQLQKLVRATSWPQAVSIHTSEEEIIELMFQNRFLVTLEEGWEVERQIVDGDWVVLNRQPSLHGLNIRACRVRVNRNPEVHTVRLPEGLLAGFAGDFDGDEFTFQWIQTAEAGVEVTDLLGVSNHLLTPQSGRPLAGPVQDAILGLYKLTQPHVFLERGEADQLLGSCSYLETYILPAPAFLSDNVAYWSGKQLFSATLPSKLCYQRDSVLIRHGQLIRGVLTAQDLSNVHSNLLHLLIRLYGHAFAVRLISDWQRLGVQYLSLCGVTCGLADCVTPITSELRTLKTKLIHEIDHHPLLSLQEEEDPQHKANDLYAEKEAKVCQLLAQSQQELKKRMTQEQRQKVDHFPNRFYQIIDSGAKAKEMNRVQLEYPGVTTVFGARMQPLFFKSTSCFFKAGDRSAKALGLVSSSFEEGLSLSEMFFQAKDARQSAINAQELIPQQGHFMRTCRMATENCHVNEKRLLVNAQEQIQEFTYGSDSISGQHLFWEPLPLLQMSVVDIQNMCTSQTDELQHLLCLKEKLKHVSTSQVEVPFPISSVVRMYSQRPVERQQILTTTQHAAGLQKLRTNLYQHTPPGLYRHDALEACLSYYLSFNQIQQRFPMDFHTFDTMIDHFLRMHRLALITPGSSLGVVATSSICEPLTQGSLGTQHKTNSHSIQWTKIPTLPEITRLSKTTFQRMTIAFRAELSDSSYTQYQKEIVHTSLLDLVQSMELCACPTTLSKWYSLSVRVECNADRFSSLDLTWTQVVSLSQRQLKVKGGELLVDFRSFFGGGGTASCYGMTLLFPKTLMEKETETQKDVTLSLLSLATQWFKGITLKGSPLIKSCTFMKTHTHTPVLVTEGSDLAFVLSLPFVDPLYTWTEDVFETAKVLGIEAAYQLILFQMHRSLTAQQAQVSARHLSLVARHMTRTGRLMPFHSFSFQTQKEMSIFQKLGFDTAIKGLVESALYQRSDPFRGVTERLMAGLLIRTGTGRYRFPSIQKQPVASSWVLQKNTQTQGLPLPRLTLRELFEWVHWPHQHLKNVDQAKTKAYERYMFHTPPPPSFPPSALTCWDPETFEQDLRDLEEQVKQIEKTTNEENKNKRKRTETLSSLVRLSNMHQKTFSQVEAPLKLKRRKKTVQEELEDSKQTKTKKLFEDTHLKKKVLEEYGNDVVIHQVLKELSHTQE